MIWRVVMKGLHGGSSLLISVTPVHNLTAPCQFDLIKEAAAKVENAGGRVVDSPPGYSPWFCKTVKILCVCGGFPSSGNEARPRFEILRLAKYFYSMPEFSGSGRVKKHTQSLKFC